MCNTNRFVTINRKNSHFKANWNEYKRENLFFFFFEVGHLWKRLGNNHAEQISLEKSLIFSWKFSSAQNARDMQNPVD